MKISIIILLIITSLCECNKKEAATDTIVSDNIYQSVNNKRKLYDALSVDYDMGTFEAFCKDVEDNTKRRKLYDAISDEYDLGSYEDFCAQLMGRSADSLVNMNDNEVKKLYYALLGKGYSTADLGDEETFRTKMSDKNNRKELFDRVASKGNFRLGDYDTYERRLCGTVADKSLCQEQFKISDNLKKVYDTLLSEGFELPKYEEFVADMRDDKLLSEVRQSLIDAGYTPPEFSVFKADMWGTVRNKMNENESRKWLYNTLRSAGYNVGRDYAEFDSLMSNNEESRKWAFETATAAGYNVGKDYDEFDNLINPRPADKSQYKFAEEPFIIYVAVFLSFFIYMIVKRIKRSLNKNINSKKKENNEEITIIKIKKETMKEMEAVVKKEYNSIFNALLVLWIVSSIISVFSNLCYYLLSLRLDEPELEIVAIISIILSIFVIVGSLLVINFHKLGVYIISVAAIINFITLLLVEDSFNAIIGNFGFLLFFILFFSIKKNGVTAYNVLFPKLIEVGKENETNSNLQLTMVEINKTIAAEKDGTNEVPNKERCDKNEVTAYNTLFLKNTETSKENETNNKQQLAETNATIVEEIGTIKEERKEEGCDKINRNNELNSRFSYKFFKRTFFALVIIFTLLIAFLFALNGRYDIAPEGMVLDKWSMKYIDL